MEGELLLGAAGPLPHPRIYNFLKSLAATHVRIIIDINILCCSDDDEGEEAVSRLRFRRPQNPFSAAPARRPNPTSSPQVGTLSTIPQFI